jgi:hypothetical protein
MLKFPRLPLSSILCLVHGIFPFFLRLPGDAYCVSYVLVSLSVLAFVPAKYGQPLIFKTLIAYFLFVILPAEYMAVLGTRWLVKGLPSDTPSWLEKLSDLYLFCCDCFGKFLFTAVLFAWFSRQGTICRERAYPGYLSYALSFWSGKPFTPQHY